ncbi:hypothetical protein [Geotalea daltonii]|uniref:hypothetical protein n=1 Tax=Geotalea daltonii TaxID=1203471 RepID=UPI00059CD57B|nr:hypothetical protein [Geotalea daltonii]
MRGEMRDTPHISVAWAEPATGSLLFLDPERFLDNLQHYGIDTGILSSGLFLQGTEKCLIYAA